MTEQAQSVECQGFTYDMWIEEVHLTKGVA